MRNERNERRLLHALENEPTLPKYKAGRVFGWGRRATDQAVRDGQLKVIDGPKQVVSTAWISAAVADRHLTPKANGRRGS